SNHCYGDDYYVAVGYVAGQLRAAFGTLDTKCNGVLLFSVTPDRTHGPRTIALAFKDSYIHQDFGYRMTAVGITNPSKVKDFDFSPNAARTWWKAVSTRTTTFHNTGVVQISSAYKTPIATGDFNHDGQTDMLMYAPGGASDRFFLGYGAGFTP